MTRITALSLALLYATTGAVAARRAEKSSVTGVWRGEMHGLPAVTLTVEQVNGNLMGAALFYLIRRNPGGAPSASPGVPEPMIDPTFDGRVLNFKISHRHAHPPQTLHDPPVSFRLELTGPDKARLLAPESPPLEMFRVRDE